MPILTFMLITHHVEGHFELQKLLQASWRQMGTCCALDAPADRSGLLSPLISARISLRSHVMSLIFQSCLPSSIGLCREISAGLLFKHSTCACENFQSGRHAGLPCAKAAYAWPLFGL